jgi:uncharacterized protein
VGLEKVVAEAEHDGLNLLGINVIRALPSGIYLWGARTLSLDPERRYVNGSRFLLYIEESISRGTEWVVFEPNDAALWSRVRQSVMNFLSQVWREGALLGRTSQEAFFVKVDAENNPSSERAAGQLIVNVGVAIVRPAEFVMIRISQKTQVT